MSRGWILAIDQGTTNTKALLVGRDGQPAFRISTSSRSKRPRPGWVEQDAASILAKRANCNSSRVSPGQRDKMAVWKECLSPTSARR